MGKASGIAELRIPSENSAASPLLGPHCTRSIKAWSSLRVSGDVPAEESG